MEKGFNKAAFADRLKEFEKDRGYEQKIVYDAMGVSQSAYSNYRNPEKTNTPPAEFLYNLSVNTGVSIDWLLGLSDVPTTAAQSPRDCCKMLLSIYRACGFRFVKDKVTHQENCPSIDGKFVKKENEYTAIFFPAYLDTNDDLKKLHDIQYPLWKKNLSERDYVNSFLERMGKAVDVCKDIKDPEYAEKFFNMLMDDALAKVPDAEELEKIMADMVEEQKNLHDKLMDYNKEHSENATIKNLPDGSIYIASSFAPDENFDENSQDVIDDR